MGGLQDAAHALPWSELMGAHLGGASGQEALSVDDTAYWARINGVFWAAFLLFSWTAASIVSGSVIERIQSGAFWVLAVMIGSFFWIIDAAWGWHWDGYKWTPLIGQRGSEFKVESDIVIMLPVRAVRCPHKSHSVSDHSDWSEAARDYNTRSRN